MTRTSPWALAVSRIAIRIVGPAILVSVWVLFADVGGVMPTILPPIEDTVVRLWEMYDNEGLFGETAWTVYRWISGFALAVFVAVPLGLLLGSSRQLYQAFEFPIEFARALPVTSLFPVFLAIWGVLGEGSKRAMIFTAAVFPVLIATIYGVWNATENRRDMARTFGATRSQVFFRVTLMEALPSIAIGMRTSMSIALIVCVLTELWIGTEYGVGARLFEAYSRSTPADMFAMVVVLGILGYGSNLAMLTIEKRLLWWARIEER